MYFQAPPKQHTPNNNKRVREHWMGCQWRKTNTPHTHTHTYETHRHTLITVTLNNLMQVYAIPEDNILQSEPKLGQNWGRQSETFITHATVAINYTFEAVISAQSEKFRDFSTRERELVPIERPVRCRGNADRCSDFPFKIFPAN